MQRSPGARALTNRPRRRPGPSRNRLRRGAHRERHGGLVRRAGGRAGGGGGGDVEAEVGIVVEAEAGIIVEAELDITVEAELGVGPEGGVLGGGGLADAKEAAAGRPVVGAGDVETAPDGVEGVDEVALERSAVGRGSG